MQAASLCFTAPLPLRNSKSLATRRLPAPQRTVGFRQVSATTTPMAEPSTVDYSSSTSVFPAEACETVGGEACDVEMFPEAKPLQETKSINVSVSSEDVDREYLEYSETKTVFPGEACDDLGGEFCEPDYQEGVYQEKALSK